MTGEFKRKLDIATNASIDLVALNNQVVKMRPVVKRSRLHVINKLTKKIKKLRNKKGTEAQKKQNNSKADNLVKEIKVIQVLKPDYISKYALGSTEKFEKLICQPNLDMERRALARLAEHIFIQDVVKKFREKHSDWKELTAYLMTKHTSRGFKKKKAPQKLTKIATNVTATEKIVETYLSDKLKDTKEEMHTKDEESGNSEASKHMAIGKTSLPLKSSETKLAKPNKQKNEDNKTLSEDTENVDSDMDEKHHFKVRRKLVKGNEKESTDDDDDDFDSDDNGIERGNDELSERLTDGEKKTSSENDDSDDAGLSKGERFQKQCKSVRHLLSDSASALDQENLKIENSLKISLKRKNKERLKREQESKDVTNETFKEKKSGEMIVKKLNLDDLTEDSIETGSASAVPEFLLKNSPQKNKRITKDPFFCTSDDEVSDGEANDIDNLDGGDDVRHANNTDASADVSDLEGEPGQLTNIKGLSTTFLGSLNSGRMMKCEDPLFRSNEDWKKMRQEKKTKFSDRGRGRGRGKSERKVIGHISHGREDSGKHRPGRAHTEAKKGRIQPAGHPNEGIIPQSKPESGEKLLRPSYLTQSTKSPPKPAQNQSSKSKTKEEHIHPSWLASKKRKEQQSSIQQFQGKKIKFDD